jgi:hypothetical protein
MKRPKKFTVNPDSYLATDIDPLLDELEALRGAEEFPTLEEFEEWYSNVIIEISDIYDYFKAFKTRQIHPNDENFNLKEFIELFLSGIGGNPDSVLLYQAFDMHVRKALGIDENYCYVFPEVGWEYEFSDDGENWHKDTLDGFDTDAEIYIHIRPIATPTRDEVIAKAKELGLTEAELEVLCNTK